MYILKFWTVSFYLIDNRKVKVIYKLPKNALKILNTKKRSGFLKASSNSYSFKNIAEFEVFRELGIAKNVFVFQRKLWNHLQVQINETLRSSSSSNLATLFFFSLFWKIFVHFPIGASLCSLFPKSLKRCLQQSTLVHVKDFLEGSPTPSSSCMAWPWQRWNTCASRELLTRLKSSYLYLITVTIEKEKRLCWEVINRRKN